MGDCAWASDRNLRRATATGRLDDQFHVAVPRRLSPLLPPRKLCETSRSPVQWCCCGCRLTLWLVAGCGWPASALRLSEGRA